MKHIQTHIYKVNKNQRQHQNKHKPMLIWFTGLSGSGKSTIANALEYKLFQNGIRTYTLDGDNVRHGLNKDLGFSQEDRQENIRRIAEVASLMIDAGLVVLAAFVSPYKKDRDSIRSIIKDVNFVEVYINTSLEECEKRDVKGLYKKARAGEISNMTGISAPYEPPINPNIEIKTEETSIGDAVEKIYNSIKQKLELKDE